MVELNSRKDRALKRAEEVFKSAERRDTASRQITEAEHATTAAKTKKLRAMRMAKEAADAAESKKVVSRKPIRVKRNTR